MVSMFAIPLFFAHTCFLRIYISVLVVVPLSYFIVRVVDGDRALYSAPCTPKV